MDVPVLQAFAREVEREKVALSAALLARYASRRAAQGVGGARQLAKHVGKVAPGTTSRQIAQKGGFTGHLLKSTREGGQLATRAKVLPSRVGLGQTASRTRARVGKAIRREASGAKTRTSTPLSKGYEGYMSSAQTTYTPKHMGQVMGVSPSKIKLKSGPSQYQKALGTSATHPGSPGFGGAAGGTAVSRPSGLRRAAGGDEAGTAVSSVRGKRRAARRAA